jgi:group I intron endonuclease
MKRGIYKISNEINGKVYIGQAINIKRRWREHKENLRKNTHKNQHLQNSWNKYGESNFKFEIIEICKEEELTFKEQLWINRFKSLNSKYGYNKREASNKGRLSKESCEKLSKSKLGHKVSEETRKKLRMIKGNKNHNYGKPMTEEQKKKISESQKGEKHHFYGKHRSEEFKKKIRGENSSRCVITEKTAKYIIKLLMDGIGPLAIARQLNISKYITASIKRKTSWKHLTKDITFPRLKKRAK